MAYTIADFRRDMRQPFAWPGGYPRYFVMNDGESLSYEGAQENVRQILDSIHNKQDDGWRIVACEVNWEDAALFCAHTNKRIESAYAEDEAAESDHDGQPDEAQEWHDFDPDC